MADEDDKAAEAYANEETWLSGQPIARDAFLAGVAHAKGQASPDPALLAKLIAAGGMMANALEAINFHFEVECATRWRSCLAALMSEDAAASLAGAAAPEETESPWVACADRMPDDDGTVLAIVVGWQESRQFARYFAITDSWSVQAQCGTYPVTHWMKLPLPPASPDAGRGAERKV